MGEVEKDNEKNWREKVECPLFFPVLLQELIEKWN
jgi:hypothetical protein